jgi:predicted cupin superfamily sugar epimerase
MSDPLEGLTAAEIIRLLDLAPHPEGGYYRETFRDPGRVEGGRAASTAIYFLLPAGTVSAWHRVDAAEIWHFHAGAPLALEISTNGETATRRLLGPDLLREQRPQLVVPAGVWQSARSLGAYTLVGCTVAPGFEFSAFELAEPGFAPKRIAG